MMKIIYFSKFREMLKRKDAVFLTLATMIIPSVVFADDPFSKSATKMSGILFGTFGTAIASMLLAGSFFLAMVGKVTWNNFLYIGFCTAGFLSAPKIITLIQDWVA